MANLYKGAFLKSLVTHVCRVHCERARSFACLGTATISDVASSFCQEGQSERTFPIFAFSSRFFFFFTLIFLWFPPLFLPIFGKFFAVRGHSAPCSPLFTLLTATTCSWSGSPRFPRSPDCRALLPKTTKNLKWIRPIVNNSHNFFQTKYHFITLYYVSCWMCWI